MAKIIISEDDFLKFQEYFYRKTGIQFEHSKRYFVDKRLVERIESTGSDSFRSYFAMLRFQASGTELQALVNLMTINETYFFREEYQFHCLVHSILPEIVAKKKKTRPYPHLGDPFVFRRRALLHRHVFAGAVARDSQVGCRDYFIRH
jgi:chemotaxis protein methyltransferase CheR